MLKITILTLFPSYFDSFLQNSIIARAIAKGVVEFEIVNIRDYTKDYKHHRVDDRPAGGGAGLIMRMQPLSDALEAVKSEGSHSVLLSPLGTTYNQEKAKEFSKLSHLILVCGHYEGVDSRFNRKVDELVSIGDYITTGGEIGALAISDSVTRLLDGAIAEESTEEESFNVPLLEYPQYTLPYDYEGDTIPDILFSGNHEAIEKWRRREAIRITRELRPDLYAKFVPDKQDLKRIRELEEGDISKTEKLALEKGRRFIEAEKKKER